MSNANSPSNKPPTGVELKLEQLLKGAQSVLDPGSTVLLNQAQITQVQFVQELTAALAPYLAVRAERATYLAKVRAKDLGEVATLELVAAARSAVVAAFGRKSPLLSHFGINPQRTVVLSSEQKVIAAAKAKLTRQKRGTLGSRQKLAVKAEGTPVVKLGSGPAQVIPAAIDTVPGKLGFAAKPTGSPASSPPPSAPAPSK